MLCQSQFRNLLLMSERREFSCLVFFQELQDTVKRCGEKNDQLKELGEKYQTYYNDKVKQSNDHDLSAERVCAHYSSYTEEVLQNCLNLPTWLEWNIVHRAQNTFAIIGGVAALGGTASLLYRTKRWPRSRHSKSKTHQLSQPPT